MGKRIKSTGVILDASSTGSAPVSPAGTVALRAKSDSTQFQYSANGGAWTDFGSGGSGTVRLDQVLDPIDPIVTPVAGVKNFAMGSNQLAFVYSGAQSEECFVIMSAEPVTPGAAGSILLLRAAGATTEKNPLRIETRNQFAFTVASTGKVAIGAETAINERLNIYQTNTGTDMSGVILGACTMDTGSTASTITASTFQLDDSQNTASLTSMHVMAVQMNRTAGVANTNITATVLDLHTNIGVTTKTVRGLTMNMSCVGTLTVTDWEGIRITAPSTVGSPTITNKRAIITESGAGNVGFGTLTPSVQLHVAGGVQVDQAASQTVALLKYVNSTEAVVQNFGRARGTSTTPANLNSADGVGTIVFYGWLAGAFSQLGYVRNVYSSTLGGVTEIGAGAVDQSRVSITETGSVGSVTLYGGAVNYFQVQTSGFQFSHGTAGSVYYKDAAGYFVNLDTVGAADVGKVLTLTNVSGAYLPRWAAGGAGSGTPGGSSLELQYNNAGAFGGIPNAHVDVAGGSNIILPAYLQIRAGTSLDQEFFISATTGGGAARFVMRTFRSDANGPYIQFDRGRGTEASKTSLAHADDIANIKFNGYIGATPTLTQLAFIQAFWHDDPASNGLGGVLRLGARDGAGAYIDISDNTPINGAVSVRMQASTHYVQVVGNGIRLSTGAVGALYYQGDLGGFTFLTALPISTNTAHVLRTDGTLPYWGASPGGSLTPPVTLTLSTAVDDNPTLLINHTQTSASALAFATKIWFNHAHAGSVSNGRRGLAVGWNQTVAGGSTNGDAILNVYGQNNSSLSLGSYHLMGVLIDSAFNTAVPTFTGLRIKEVNATIRRAITVDILAGDVVIGGNVPNGQLHGYLYIPTISGTPTTDITTVLPSNTCALIFDRTNNKLYANDAGASWVDLSGPPAGSGSELQYRNAGAFGAVGSSSVDGNNMITLSGGTVGQLTLQNDTQTALYLQHASTSNYPGIIFSRARGTWGSKSAVLSGDHLGLLQYAGYYNASNSLTGAQVLLSATANWSSTSAPTVFRIKTTHINQTTPRERVLIGASRDITDNTLADVFTITFGTTDQVGGGGELHIVFVAKQVSGTVATQVYRRKFSFIAGHNGATNTSMFHMKEDPDDQASAASTGSFTAISHAINADAAVAISTAVPSTPNLIATNVITYKILANSSLTTFSQFTMYYHIIYHGEIDITLP